MNVSMFTLSLLGNFKASAKNKGFLFSWLEKAVYQARISARSDIFEHTKPTLVLTKNLNFSQIFRINFTTKGFEIHLVDLPKIWVLG